MRRSCAWRDHLAEFLSSAASARELEQFVRACHREVHDSIVWSGTDQTVEVIEQLQRRGLLDALFFAHIREWRTERAADVDAIQAVWIVENGDATSAPALRRRIDHLFVDDATFEAFCHDYLPRLHRRFSNGMDRTAKTTMLIRSVPPPTLLALLHHWEQDNANDLR